jgi:hypothetical protein
MTVQRAAAASAPQIAAWLATVLGDEQALQVVTAAAAELGYRASARFTPEAQRLILERLGVRPDLTGTVARHVLKRHGLARPNDETGVRPKASTAASPTIQLDEIIKMFARALGDEKAQETLQSECRSRGFGDPLTLEEATELLEGMAIAPGLVAIAARFAKARLALLR